MRRGIDPGQQLVDPIDWVALGEAGEHAAEIRQGIDGVELAGLDQRGQGRPMFGSAVGAGEQGILPGQRQRPDRALDGVGVDLDAAVVEEAGEAEPAAERVADGFGQGGLLRDLSISAGALILSAVFALDRELPPPTATAS